MDSYHKERAAVVFSIGRLHYFTSFHDVGMWRKVLEMLDARIQFLRLSRVLLKSATLTSLGDIEYLSHKWVLFWLEVFDLLGNVLRSV